MFVLIRWEAQILIDMVVCVDCNQFNVHKIVMATHSQYFCDLLLDNYKKCPNGPSIYNIGCVSAPVFKELLNYMYTGGLYFILD